MIDAARIIQDYAAGGTSHRKLAQKYGTSVGTVGRILRGQAAEKPAPKLRRTVQEAWLSTIRYGGVQYIGHTEEVEIGTLLVMHGNRANEHAALSLLSDQAYQVSVMAGHVHRLTYADREGRRYMVQACTSGCAQKLIPEYVATKGHSMTRKWQHGVAFGTVDMRSTFVDLDNIRFSRQNGIMLAHLDGEVLEQAADSDTKGRAA